MDKENEKASTNESILESAAQASQVTPAKNKSQQKTGFFWLFAGMMALFLVSLTFHHATKQKVDQQEAPTDNSQSMAILKQNLEMLREKDMMLKTQLASMNLQGTAASVSPQQTSPNNPSTSQWSEQQQKEFEARQNAPTNMYSAKMPDASTGPGANNPNGVRTATLAGSSGMDQFANQNTSTTTIDATKIPHPEFTIASGEMVHAVLETAIDSDLPGMVRAVIRDPVYAYLGEKPLIPAGSRLIGQYSSGILMGQRRVMVVWNRVILPNGVAVQINSPGTDDLGQSGQGADSFNTHFIARFGEATLLSVLGAGASFGGVSTSDQFNSASSYRMAMSQSFQQSAQQSLQDTLPTQTTLHVYQGAQINVFVAHDLDFFNVLGQPNNGG